MQYTCYIQFNDAVKFNAHSSTRLFRSRRGVSGGRRFPGVILALVLYLLLLLCRSIRSCPAILGGLTQKLCGSSGGSQPRPVNQSDASSAGLDLSFRFSSAALDLPARISN